MHDFACFYFRCICIDVYGSTFNTICLLIKKIYQSHCHAIFTMLGLFIIYLVHVLTLTKIAINDKWFILHADLSFNFISLIDLATIASQRLNYHTLCTLSCMYYVCIYSKKNLDHLINENLFNILIWKLQFYVMHCDIIFICSVLFALKYFLCKVIFLYCLKYLSGL